MKRFKGYILSVAALALLVGACAPQPPAPPLSPAAQTRALIALGAQRQAQGWYEGAVDAYRAALSTARKSALRAEALVGLARAMVALGAAQRALKVLEQMPGVGVPKALAREARLVKAEALKALGRHAEAAAEFEALLRATDEATPNRLKLFEELCAQLLKAGQRTKAIRLVLGELKREGVDRDVLTERLVTLASGANPAQLRVLLQEVGPGVGRAALLMGLARALAREGRTREALAALARVRTQPAAGRLATQAETMARELSSRQQTNPRAVGVVLPLSGRYAPYGSGLLGAVELGLGVVGDQGCGLKLFIADSKASAEQAAQAVEELVKNRGVVAIIGPVGAGPALAAARKAQQLGVAMVALAQVPGLTEAGEFVFQSSLTPRQELMAVLEKAAADGLKAVAALAPDNSYGKGFVGLLKRLGPVAGLKVVRVLFYEPTQTDFSEQIRALVHLPSGSYKPGEEGAPKPVIDFDALFIPDGPARLAMVLPQLAYYDVVGPRLLGTSLWHDRAMLKLPERFVAGCIIPDTFDPAGSSPVVQGFVRAFAKAMGRVPNRLEAHAFDAAVAIRSLLCGSHPPLSRQQLRKALATLEGVEGSCGVIGVDGLRQLRVKVKLLTIKDGRFVVIGP